MKILLFGEYSGFHKNLKRGLEQLGYNVVVVGSKDGYKKIDVDINLYPEVEKNKYYYFISKQLKILKITKNLKDYDIVQIINPFLFINSLGYLSLEYNKYLMNLLIENNKSTFLSSCGNDAFYVQIGKDLMEYNAIDPAKVYIPKKTLKEKKSALKWNIELFSKANGLIPVGYEYWVGYNKYFGANSKISQPIPPMIDTREVLPEPFEIKDKIIFFHGINKPFEKGSYIIIEAMEKLRSAYPNDVELMIVKNLPYNEYVKMFAKSHVNIDQVYSYAYGMNALISMAKGKITLSGAEKIAIDAIGVENCPVINIKPSVDDVFRKLLKVLDEKDSLAEQSIRNRNFVVDYHDSKVIASKYLKFWLSKIK